MHAWLIAAALMTTSLSPPSPVPTVDCAATNRQFAAFNQLSPVLLQLLDHRPASLAALGRTGQPPLRLVVLAWQAFTPYTLKQLWHNLQVCSA